MISKKTSLRIIFFSPLFLGILSSNYARCETHDQFSNLIFFSFKSGRPGKIESLIMSEIQYKIVSPYNIQEFQNEEQYNQNVKMAVDRAKQSFNESFNEIRQYLKEAGFNWEKAELERVVVQAPREKLESTKFIEYNDNDERNRIDIYLIIKTDIHKIRIQVDDCFKVNGNRFIGNGFRLAEYNVLS